ncbi:MAG: cytochrome c biogenesis protein CcsA [Myxococcales bacterium]|nr:cytochrome c biogenesis protein CcsA [Myxococcales bacterium]
MSTHLILIASLTFLVATLVYGAHLRRFGQRSGLAGRALLGLGGLLTTGGLMARLAEGTQSGALELTFLTLAAAGSLAAVVFIRGAVPPLYGAFVAPVATMLTYSLHVFDREADIARTGEVALVTPIHVLTSLAGFVAFGVAAVCAGLEVLQEYRLKTKRFTLGQTWNLAGIERISHIALLIAFPLYSIGLALGAVWFARGDSGAVTRHAIMASSSWVVFALLLYARLVFGLKGRRAAVLTLAAFGLSLFVVLLSALRIMG